MARGRCRPRPRPVPPPVESVSYFQPVVASSRFSNIGIMDCT
jgi:hypothetical protein